MVHTTHMNGFSLNDMTKTMELCAKIAENTIVFEYEGVDIYGDAAAKAIRASITNQDNPTNEETDCVIHGKIGGVNGDCPRC